MKMRGIAACLVAYFGILGMLTMAQKPWEPTPRPDSWWVDRHNQFVRQSQQNASNIEIVFVGSSSIEQWSSTGQALWNSKYAPLGSINYGIGGDRIENCLWRVMNGELEGLDPKMVVLYCGSNNIGNPNNTEIMMGITATIDEIHRRLPNTTVLYMSLNPRGDIQPVPTMLNRTLTINQELTLVHDGKNKTIVFDMFDSLIISMEQINTFYFQPDNLHLNLQGYQLWDRLWNNTFFGGLN